MSKYRHRGAYHYDEFIKETPYRKHVLDVLHRVRELVPHGGTILDLGAGEGLILSKLREAGYDAEGCDIDEEAVRLARTIGNPVQLGMIDTYLGRWFDAVVALDVLEHVSDFVGTIHKMTEVTDRIIIAVPDRHDPYSEREVSPIDVAKMLGPDWETLFSVRRHARNVMGFQRRQEE